MAKRTFGFKEIIAQFLLIVFSVVLGIYLSERLAERKQRKESEQLLSKLESELKDNLDLLDIWVPYHRGMYENMDTLFKDPIFVQQFIDNKFVFFEKLLTKGTFMGRFPASDAWDIAKSHPLIVNVEYEKLLALSRIYNQQENSFEPIFEIFEIFNQNDVNTVENAKANLESISYRMRNLVALEDQLMMYYKNAEDVLTLDR